MLDMRKSSLVENLYADQEGIVYYQDKHGDYIEYSQHANKGGYKHFNFRRLGKQTNLYVHRVVASAFHGDSPEGRVCAHLNGNPGDNRAENLAWVTQKENLSHRREHGTEADTKGERNGSSKLTESRVREIRAKYETGVFTQRELAAVFSVSQTQIYRVVNRKTWAHL